MLHEKQITEWFNNSGEKLNGMYLNKYLIEMNPCLTMDSAWSQTQDFYKDHPPSYYLKCVIKFPLKI